MASMDAELRNELLENFDEIPVILEAPDDVDLLLELRLFNIFRSELERKLKVWLEMDDDERKDEDAKDVMRELVACIEYLQTHRIVDTALRFDDLLVEISSGIMPRRREVNNGVRSADVEVWTLLISIPHWSFNRTNVENIGDFIRWVNTENHKNFKPRVAREPINEIRLDLPLRRIPVSIDARGQLLGALDSLLDIPVRHTVITLFLLIAAIWAYFVYH